MDIKPVIVSALFDINRDSWSNFTMSYNTYTSWAQYLLSMNTPIVFFTEEKFKKSILETRMLYDPNLKQTKIIIKEKEELELYKSHYHKVKELMQSDKFAKIVQFKDVPEMCQHKLISPKFPLTDMSPSMKKHAYTVNSFEQHGHTKIRRAPKVPKSQQPRKCQIHK